MADDCSSPNLDLVVVFDNTVRLLNRRHSAFSANKYLLLDILGSLKDGTNTRVAVVSFDNNTPEVTLEFTDISSRHEIFSKIENIKVVEKKPSYSDPIIVALEYLHSEGRADAHAVLVILGNGKSGDSYDAQKAAAARIRETPGLTCFAVDSSSATNINTLQTFTGSLSRVYSYERNAEFVKNINRLANALNDPRCNFLLREAREGTRATAATDFGQTFEWVYSTPPFLKAKNTVQRDILEEPPNDEKLSEGKLIVKEIMRTTNSRRTSSTIKTTTSSTATKSTTTATTTAGKTTTKRPTITGRRRSTTTSSSFDTTPATITFTTEKPRTTTTREESTTAPPKTTRILRTRRPKQTTTLTTTPQYITTTVTAWKFSGELSGQQEERDDLLLPLAPPPAPQLQRELGGQQEERHDLLVPLTPPSVPPLQREFGAQQEERHNLLPLAPPPPRPLQRYIFRTKRAFTTPLFKTYFLKKHTEELEEPSTTFRPGCLLDVIIVLDASGSVEVTFRREKELAAGIVSRLRIGPNNSRVSIIKFAGAQQVKTVWSFGDVQAKGKILRVLDSVSFTSGTTAIHSALLKALSEYTSARGARPGSARAIAIVFTDGFSQRPTFTEAAMLRAVIPDTYAYRR
ncbi:hypothetical protein KIN20_013491 [Parelaphostrongylus tenuis]|uniref:VWFA domain-containing protein n=1 Tax=Parelaphostrongylus tenuis TaxID=148309 RepID=A0AAD5MFP1_PARTN|nr:hypothetical protein KIN20_013491 [Parelaphostrongylus tenuis]